MNRASLTLKRHVCPDKTFCGAVVTFSDSAGMVTTFFCGPELKLEDFEGSKQMDPWFELGKLKSAPPSK